MSPESSPTPPAPPAPAHSAGAVPSWLPNAITVLRIVLIPVFLGVAQACASAARDGEPYGLTRAVALATLVAIGASDLVDGFLARRYGLATPLGATLDALADKLAQVAALVFFTFSRSPAFAQVPVWFLAVILARDVVLGAGWLAIKARLGRVEVVHEPHGKFASFLVFGLAVWVTADLPRILVGPTLVVVAVLVALSTASYFRDGWRQVVP